MTQATRALVAATWLAAFAAVVASASGAAAPGANQGDTRYFTLDGHYGGSAGPVALFGLRAVVGYSSKLAVLDLYPHHDYPPVTGYLVMPRPIDSITAIWTGHPTLRPGHVLVGVEGHGIYIVDCGNPEEPRIVGQWSDGRDHYTDIAWRGSLAYVTTWSGSQAFRTSTLLILDLSRPEAPRLVSATVLPGRYADAVRLSGDHAYVAVGWGGMAVVDIADPTAPRLRARVGTGGYASALEIVAGHVLLVDGGLPRSAEAALEQPNTRPVLTVLDIADPVVAQEIAFTVLPGRPIDTALSDGVLYIAERPYLQEGAQAQGGGLRAFQVTDPTQPVELGAIAPPGGAAIEGLAALESTQDNTFSDGYVIATFGLAGLTTNSFAVNGQTEQTARRPGTAVPAACDAAVLGDRVFATWSGSVYELPIVDPKWPGQRHPVLEEPLASPGDACAMAVLGDEHLLVGDGHRLRVYDTSAPGQLLEIGSAGDDAWGKIRALVAVGDVAYVAEAPRLADPEYVGGGLRVVDLSDPTAPVDIGLVPRVGDPRAIAADASVAVVAYEDGLTVYDIVRSAYIVRSAGIVGSAGGDGALPTGHEPLRAANDTAGASAQTDLPRERGTLLLPRQADIYDVAVRDGHALVASGTCDTSWDAVVGRGGLDIFDLNSLEHVSYISTASAFSLAVDGDIAHVATQCGGSSQPVTAIDVSEPAAPQPLGRLEDRGGEIHLLAVDGRIVTIWHLSPTWSADPAQWTGQRRDELLVYSVSRARRLFVPAVQKGNVR